MRNRLIDLVVILPLVIMCASCIPDTAEERCGDGFIYKDDNCYREDTDTADTNADSGTSDAGGDQGIGLSCSCQGEGCEQMGVPVPNGGDMVGCSDVPSGWLGAELVCLRSYVGEMTTNTYFANGFCSLMAVSCVGNDMLCAGAIMGDHGAMVACPAGTVLIQGSEVLEVMSMSATLDSKRCAPVCEGEDDCRGGEHDSVLDEATQYQCIDEQGVRFCYDPRNLPSGYTVEEF